MNEQARGQDVLALYNITTATGIKLTEMKTSTSNLFLEMKNNQTMEMNDLKQDFDNQLASFQTSYNATINDLHTKEISMQKQITENNERGMLKIFYIVMMLHYEYYQGLILHLTIQTLDIIYTIFSTCTKPNTIF